MRRQQACVVYKAPQVGTRLGRAPCTLERRSISGLAMRDCDAREVVSLTPAPLPSGEG
jgi:hypothetical protein